MECSKSGAWQLTGFSCCVSEVRLRAMLPDDIPSIMEIERRNYSVPWSEGIFHDCLKAGYKGFALLQDDVLIGYAMLQIGFKESHVLNVCIDAVSQGNGHARRLLAKMETESIKSGAEMMFLEVRPSNPRARALYERNGFNEISVRRNYYDTPNGREDAVVMAKTLVA